MISNVFENIYDQFRFPEELRKQLNFSSSLGEISVTYPLTPYIDITVSDRKKVPVPGKKSIELCRSQGIVCRR